jgi:hypothetical protein
MPARDFFRMNRVIGLDGSRLREIPENCAAPASGFFVACGKGRRKSFIRRVCRKIALL